MDFFKRLFKGEDKVPPDQASTAPLDPLTLSEFFVDDIKPHLMTGTFQSIGEERESNDDSLLVLSGTAVSSDGLPDFALLCVADGLGGYKNGAKASAISVRSIAGSLTQGAILDLLAPDPVRPSDSLVDMVKLAVERANREVRAKAEGGATTLTIAFVVGNEATVGHVGDTRAYRIDDGGMHQLTKDHSLVQQLMDTGTISEDEAAVHPQRNVLWNAIGKAIDVRVDVATHVFPPGSYLLICSDGLWGVIPEERILEIVREVDIPQLVSEALVTEANKSGGSDNVTVVAVKFPEVPNGFE